MGSKNLHEWKKHKDFISENQRKLVFFHTVAIGQRVDVHAWHCWSLRLSISESYWNTNCR